MNKQIIFSSEQLGRAILWGTVFFSIWFRDSNVDGDITSAIFMLMLYFLFGGMFLDAMKNLWKYKKVNNDVKGGLSE